VPAFVRAAEARLAQWRAAPAGAAQPIDVEMTRATFDVVAATLLPSADATLPAAIQKSVAMLSEAAGWDLLFASLNLPPWMPHPGMATSVRAMKTLRSRVASVIAERRAAGGEPGADLTRRPHRRARPRDLPGDGRRAPRGQRAHLLPGGARDHREGAHLGVVPPRALAGMVRGGGGRGRARGRTRAPDGGPCESLVATQQVLKEAMRLYPPVPIMSRQALVDAEVEGHAVRAGTSMLIPIYAVHRHEGRWADAHLFRPERFSPENEPAIPRYQYIPFGAGPRVCIGRSFAMLEATVMLATFLRAGELRDDGAEPVPVARVTLVPRDGLRLKVRLRASV
jgi:cytochrome P450